MALHLVMISTMEHKLDILQLIQYPLDDAIMWIQWQFRRFSRTYAGSTHATSPATNLAGRSNIPFHAWVHEGRSGCGEALDSEVNLQFKYKTASGTWTTFHTFKGWLPNQQFQYSTTPG